VNQSAVREAFQRDIEPERAISFRVTWTDRVTGEPHGTSVEATVAELLASTNTQQAKADAIIAYAKSLSELWTAEALAVYAAEVQATIDTAIRMRPEDDDLIEIRDLFQRYAGDLIGY